MYRPFLEVSAAQGERHFRWRGGDVSRLEGLTDAVFALALTLIVVTLQVPRTFAEMTEAFLQAPAFLFCFAILYWFWACSFRFHRRYGLEDAVTIVLTAVLLFLVLLYVYPLKFVMTTLWNGVLGRGLRLRDAVGERVLDPVTGAGSARSRAVRAPR